MKDAMAITGKENETLILKCNLSSGIPREDLMWNYRDHTLKRGGAGSLELTLKLKPFDSGIYACSAISSFLETPLVKTIVVAVLCE